MVKINFVAIRIGTRTDLSIFHEFAGFLAESQRTMGQIAVSVPTTKILDSCRSKIFIGIGWLRPPSWFASQCVSKELLTTAGTMVGAYFDFISSVTSGCA
ncbi:MAG: hypothetical protein ACK52L_24315 [Pirellula sp.]